MRPPFAVQVLPDNGSCKIGNGFPILDCFFICFQLIKEILMAGASLEPKQILAYSADKGTAKAENRFDRLAVLGFLGGAL